MESSQENFDPLPAAHLRVVKPEGPLRIAEGLEELEPEAGCLTQDRDGESWAIPPGVFPIPAGSITFTKSAGIIFGAIAGSHRLFMRGGAVHEVMGGAHEPAYLAPLAPHRFCSLVESFGFRVARREETQEGEIKWRSKPMPEGSARILLASDPAAELLPPIRQLPGCPVMTPYGEVLGRGYHEHGGGTYITAGDAPPEVPLETAVTALTGLLRDFNFTAPADKSRAMASLISPALKMGGWIDDDFPLDVAEADQSQSGKTYRLKLINTLYGEIPSAITAPVGGVGSVDESISTALIRARPFVMIDNFRGRLDSAVLEQAIRGAGKVTCRALRVSAEVDVTPFLFQLSTNGAEFTRDLANRSIITRIKKQPAGYRFFEWAEGDLLKHVAANRTFYLGCIFAVLREWKSRRFSKTSEHRHDFRAWCRALDWITQNIFHLPPLLDGHAQEQARTANPALQWVRDICMAAKAAKQLDRALSASDLVEIAEGAGLEFPGNRASRQEPNARAGTILGRLYSDTDGQPLQVDGFTISRAEEERYHADSRMTIKYKFYTICRSESE